LLSTPIAPGPGEPVGPDSAPRLPVESSLAREAAQAGEGDRPVYRYRARYSKSGDLRFIGHLDLARLILRALRRSGLELLYSRGFNPKPKVGFGPALAVGVASSAEYIDFDTYRRLGQDDAEADINGALPDGLRFDLVKEIPRSAAALGEAIRAARYRVSTRAGGDLAEAVDAFRARLPIEVRRQKKNGKTQRFDLTEELLSVEATEPGSLSMTLVMHHDGASVRPDEVLREIFGGPVPVLDLEREELLVDWKGRLVNPILAASASSPGT
jgi:radical SAM-linked protein